jgi:hypothetical protein
MKRIHRWWQSVRWYFLRWQLQRAADRMGIPGPKVDAHPEGYDKACLCALCCSYGD